MRGLLPGFFFCLLLFFAGCQGRPVSCQGEESARPEEPWAWDGLDALKAGDILVRPNMNLLPGTSVVEGGFSFGHAAVVTKGARHSSADSILAMATIFESHARDVPAPWQLREIAAWATDDDPRWHNDSFSPRHRGLRYRLRLPLSEEQADSVVNWLRARSDDQSSWMAMGQTSGHDSAMHTGNSLSTVTYWYCSLLVWQAFSEVCGIDLDANQGHYVYPNDLINSPYFDNRAGFRGRVRF